MSGLGPQGRMICRNQSPGKVGRPLLALQCSQLPCYLRTGEGAQASADSKVGEGAVWGVLLVKAPG